MWIIFSDIDGTLINDKLEILPRTKESILKEVKKRQSFCSCIRKKSFGDANCH
ncbi:HAD hydrolase family protein [Lactobacillus jensenii]|uniref:HAD hydrolase family protein n=1 Tax=Lactobacillus jensenii TaxID=109790 RepID=UPI0028701BFF|nr:HAD hydrolase family protein [Lactobacillus jensenii]